jgi:hypothetical protein
LEGSLGDELLGFFEDVEVAHYFFGI